MECDVLIIGGGLAGRNAAAELREKYPRLQTVIVDAGGCASTEIMGFCAPVMPGDSPECFAADILKTGAGANSPELAYTLAERALPEMKRLENAGIVFDRETDGSYAVIRSIGSSFPRVVHSGTTTGKQAMKLLDFPVRKCRICRLLKGPSGKIAGAVSADGEIFRAKAVIIAAGGFAGLWEFSTWSKSLRGDLLIQAMEIGAELCNLGCAQFEPTVTVSPAAAKGFPVITTLLHEGAKLYDAAGNDLVADDVPPKRELAMRIQQAIEDGHGFENGGVCYDLSGVEEEVLKRKYPEYLKKYLQWFPDVKSIRFEVRPGAHTTLGGIRIQADCSTSVPGLFAAGEAVGNLHGRDRLGGNAGLEVFVFGRIAGASAGKYADGKSELEDFTDVPHTEEEITQNVLSSCFTPLPDREKLRQGAAELEKLPQTAQIRFIKQVFQDKLKDFFSGVL